MEAMIQASKKKGAAITEFYSFLSSAPNAKASASSVTRPGRPYVTTIAKIAAIISSLSKKITENVLYYVVVTTTLSKVFILGNIEV